MRDALEVAMVDEDERRLEEDREDGHALRPPAPPRAPTCDRLARHRHADPADRHDWHIERELAQDRRRPHEHLDRILARHDRLRAPQRNPTRVAEALRQRAHEPRVVRRQRRIVEAPVRQVVRVPPLDRHVQRQRHPMPLRLEVAVQRRRPIAGEGAEADREPHDNGRGDRHGRREVRHARLVHPPYPALRQRVVLRGGRRRGQRRFAHRRPLMPPRRRLGAREDGIDAV